MQTTELPADLLLPRNMRGAKWFNGASYISDKDRALVIERVRMAKACPGLPDPRTVGVRVASYIGEPHPICIITHGPGGSRIWESVHR